MSISRKPQTTPPKDAVQSLFFKTQPASLILEILRKIPKDNPYSGFNTKTMPTEYFVGREFAIKVRAALQNKKKPVFTGPGLCNGLSLLWLYTTGIKNVEWFYAVKRSIMMDAHAAISSHHRDIFLNVVNVWQDPSLHIDGIKWPDMDKLFNCKMQTQSGAMDLAQLTLYLANLQQEDLARISSDYDTNNHAIGVAYDGHTYSLFDTGYSNRNVKLFTAAKSLAQEIHRILKIVTADTVPIIINITNGTQLRPQPSLYNPRRRRM